MDRFDEALQRRATRSKTDGGSNIGKIIAALESNSNASIKCDAKDSAALQVALANLSDEQRRNVRISNSDGFISVDIVAVPPKETDADKNAKDKKNGQHDTSAAEEKMDDRLDKDSKKKNKKAKKDSKRQKKADNIKNQASERVNKFDNAVDKAANTPNARQAGKALEKKGGKALHKAAGKGVEKAAAKAAGKAAAKTTAKIAGKATLKSILKKIPVVSLAAGCFFGYQRLKEGDWKGALGEVASGTLGCFPGIGTAASVAVDAGLAVRDIHQATHPVQATAQTDGRKMPAVVPQELRAEINQRGIPQKQRSQHTPSSLSAEQAAFLHQQNSGRC